MTVQQDIQALVVAVVQANHDVLVAKQAAENASVRVQQAYKAYTDRTNDAQAARQALLDLIDAQ